MPETVVGKICPYCQTRFTGTERVQVCAQCRIPHHEECWQENGGCTSFGCTGMPQGPVTAAGGMADALPDNVEITVDDLSVCAFCGQPISMWDARCAHCGNSTDAVPARTGGGVPQAGYAGAGFKDFRSPATACLLNLLLPGAGYFYLDQVGKGIVVLVIALVALPFTCGIGTLIALIYSMVDCYYVAKAQNLRANAPPPLYR